MLAAFDILYHHPSLYWLASTIPFAGQWRVWQRLVLPRLVGLDVLEVGCGPGWLLADMVAAGYRCRAIDASASMVAATRRNLARRGLVAGQDIVTQARAQALPFLDASFDSVVSTFPAPYIADPPSLAEIARVLRPGGRLIVVIGATLTPTKPLLRPLIWVQQVVYGRTDTQKTDGRASPRLPLAQFGFAPERSEVVRGPFWVAYLIIAEKSANTANVD